MYYKMDIFNSQPETNESYRNGRETKQAAVGGVQGEAVTTEQG